MSSRRKLIEIIRLAEGPYLSSLEFKLRILRLRLFWLVLSRRWCRGKLVLWEMLGSRGNSILSGIILFRRNRNLLLEAIIWWTNRNNQLLVLALREHSRQIILNLQKLQLRNRWIRVHRSVILEVWLMNPKEVVLLLILLVLHLKLIHLVLLRTLFLLSPVHQLIWVPITKIVNLVIWRKMVRRRKRK